MTDLQRIEQKLDLILSVLNIQPEQATAPVRDADRRAAALADFAAKKERQRLRQSGN